MALTAVGDREIIAEGAFSDGTATCHHVHSWPVRWFIRTERVQAQFGTYPETGRVVEPANCPTCGERYDQIR